MTEIEKQTNDASHGAFHLLIPIQSVSPLLLKYSLEYLPDRAKGRGTGPSSSMMWAMWSETQTHMRSVGGVTLQCDRQAGGAATDPRPGCSLLLSGVQTGNLLLPARTPGTATHRHPWFSVCLHVCAFTLFSVCVPCKRCSRCRPQFRTRLQSEPPGLGTAWFVCPQWSACAVEARGTQGAAWLAGTSPACSKSAKWERGGGAKGVTHHPAGVSQVGDLHPQLVGVLGIQRAEDEVRGTEAWDTHTHTHN